MDIEKLFECPVCQSRKEVFAMMRQMARIRGDAAMAALEALGPNSLVLTALTQISGWIDFIDNALIRGVQDCPGHETPAKPIGDDGYLGVIHRKTP
jgi:hypothetical protein